MLAVAGLRCRRSPVDCFPSPKEVLLVSYGVACEGTSLEGSRLVIEEIPVVVYCPTCRAETTLASVQRFCCDVC
ncbi:MAG: hydrogenase/urease maturation nickel metallochaperone HypA [Pyrinomonadaceae bacterium]